MFVKKFEGDTLDEALKMVKKELGPDAIILKTVTNKGLKGAFRKSRIEITAAISEQTYEKKARVDHVLSEDQRDQFYQAPASRINNMINEYSGNRSVESAPVESNPAGYGSMGLNKVVNTVSRASNKIKNSLDDFLSMEEGYTDSNSKLDNFLTSPKSEPVPQVERNLDAKRVTHNDTESEAIWAEASSELKQEVKSQRHQIELLEKKLFEMAEQVSRPANEAEQEPSGVKGLRTTLRSLDLSETIVQKVIKKAIFELTKEELEDADLIYDFALRELNEMIVTAMPLFSGSDVQETPVVTTLISENSAGQTSMALKLAVIQENVKVIRFRDREVDGLENSFTAKVFNIDVETVDTLAHLMSVARSAISEGKSLILDLKLAFKDNNESRKFIETLKRSFDKLEILGTISAIHNEMYNRKILSKYNTYLDGVIISNVDQCMSFGSLLNTHVAYNSLPLKFFGTGPTVPDDIEAATAERILAGMFEL